jgi:hypothetical protein
MAINGNSKINQNARKGSKMGGIMSKRYKYTIQRLDPPKMCLKMKNKMSFSEGQDLIKLSL